MKPIVNSQLTGKWYNIARTYNCLEVNFVDVFIYISISCGKYLDLLYVGVKNDRSKILKKMSLEIITENNSNFIVIKKNIIRKKLRVLSFDEKAGFIIVSDDNMKYFSVFSRKSVTDAEELERFLSTVDFSNFNKKEIKLYVIE